MKTIDRQILGELAGPFCFGVAAFTSIMFGGKYLQRLTEDIVKGLPTGVALKILVLYLPDVIVMTLPMAALLAVLLGFGRMSSDSEVVALFAGGISFYRVVAPVILFGLAVTGLTILLNEVVAPRTNLASARLRQEILKTPITTSKPVFLIDRDEDVTNAVIYVRGGYDAPTQTLRDVMVTIFRDNKPWVVFIAKLAKWEGGENWSLSDGSWHPLTEKGAPSGNFGKCNTKTVNIGMTPEEVAMAQRTVDQMTYRELREFTRQTAQRGGDTAELEVSLYNKLSLPLACLVFAMVGAPLGMRRHRGGSSVGLGLSIVIIVAYWMLWHYMVALAKAGQIQPLVGAFLADGLGLLLGAILIVRASK